MRVLIIGFNTRHIVYSANAAGYTVYSLSNFADKDLIRYSEKSVTQDFKDLPDIDLNELKNSLEHLIPVDCLVLGPGFEHYGPMIASLIGQKIPLLNNQPVIMAMASDKLWLSEKLKSDHLPHPVTHPLSPSIPDNWTNRFPAIIKPIHGAGGIDTVLINNPDDLREAVKQLGDNVDHFLLQEFVRGPVVSVSVISTGDEAVAIAVNEQLAGIPELTKMPFAYCGNITPYISDYTSRLCDIAVKLAVDLQLVGSNGIDFIITDDGPVVLEINPRFQGSIDTIERATGLNIFQAHCDAFEGRLPVCRDYQCYCIKVIFFAPRKFTITGNMSRYLTECMHQKSAVDIPGEGDKFTKDDPVVSFIATGDSRSVAIQKVKYLVSGLLNVLNNTED